MNNYDVETPEYIKHGMSLLQATLFGASEHEHAQRYCELTRPSGVVVDMGAGVGGMGQLMQKICPDVVMVINVTNSAVQAEHIRSTGEIAVLSDFRSVPLLDDSTVDFVMFNESFGYGEPKTLLPEAARMLRPNGRLVIKDFLANTDLTHIVECEGWDYKVYPLHQILEAAAEAGLRCVLLTHPTMHRAHWNAFMEKSKMRQWHGNAVFDISTALLMFIRTSGLMITARST